MQNETPPRDMVALAILLADVIGGTTDIGVLGPTGIKNKVARSFELADEFIKQSKEKK